MSKPNNCPWCAGLDDDDVDLLTLCRTHEAEHDGMSEDQLDRRDAEQDAEYDEWVLGR